MSTNQLTTFEKLLALLAIRATAAGLLSWGTGLGFFRSLAVVLAIVMILPMGEYI